MAGKGFGDAVGPIKTGINVGQKVSETLFPQTKQVFQDYWSGDIAKVLLIQKMVYLLPIFGQVIQLCFVVMVKNFILKKEIP